MLVARVAQAGTSTAKGATWPGGMVLVPGDAVGQADRHGRGVLEDEAQLPTGQLRRRIGGPGAGVPHFQLPGAIGILADEGVERLLGQAVEIQVRAGGQERRRGELDRNRSQVGVLGEHHIGRDRADDRGGVFPKCVGIGVVSFVHDNHDVSGDARTEGDSRHDW